MPERDWLNFIPGIKPGYAPWMHDHGSLTKRIKRHSQTFHVQNLYSGLSIANRDEVALLNISRRQHIYTREVLLFADDQPVVFAHSVVAAHHLRGAWRTLQHLGNRSLGSLLFTHPLVQRAPLRYRALRSDHSLYRSAVLKLDTLPPRLWARRSVFTLYGVPLLVTEIFLPEILKLNKQC